MRDLQAAVSRYYAATGNHADFVPELRAFITHTQAINDLLTESIADKTSFKTALVAPDLDHLGLFWCVGFVFVLVMGGLGLGFG